MKKLKGLFLALGLILLASCADNNSKKASIANEPIPGGVNNLITNNNLEKAITVEASNLDVAKPEIVKLVSLNDAKKNN